MSGLMTAKHLPVAGAIILITLLGFFFYPGHTYLQQDNQIYVPILEHLWDNTMLAMDPIAVQHHVTFTIYDEIMLTLRRLTGLGFQELMTADQLVSRALGILGVYMIAVALGLSSRMALIAAGVFALGATAMGPMVLSVEYEPKPRGSAIALLMLAVGCVAQGRHLAAGIVASLAFLYHPPATYPFWAVYFCLVLWPSRPDVMKRRLLALAPLTAAVVALFVFSRLQIGPPEPQPFLGVIDPELEQLQKMRAPYAWISTWFTEWIGQYLLLWGVSIAAVVRLRKSASFDLRLFLIGLPLVGMLSLPVSYLLLDEFKWALMPKFQPARAVLFVAIMAAVLAIMAALRAAQSRRIPEALLWGAVAFMIPIQARLSDLSNLGNPVNSPPPVGGACFIRSGSCRCMEPATPPNPALGVLVRGIDSSVPADSPLLRGHQAHNSGQPRT